MIFCTRSWIDIDVVLHKAASPYIAFDGEIQSHFLRLSRSGNHRANETNAQLQRSLLALPRLSGR